MKSPLVPLGITLLVVGLTVFLMWPHKPRLDPKDYHYLYCSSCDKDRPYKAELLQQGCERCGSPLEPTKESLKQIGQRPNPYSRIFAVVLVELVIAMGIVVMLAKPRHALPEIEYCYMRCTNEKCKQKIRYQERQIGNPGACRRCKRRFTFPERDPNWKDDEPGEWDEEY